MDKNKIELYPMTFKKLVDTEGELLGVYVEHTGGAPVGILTNSDADRFVEWWKLLKGGD